MKKLLAALTLLAIAAGSGSTPASAQSNLNRQNMADKAAIVQRYYWYEELLASANSEDIIAMQTTNFVNVANNNREFTREQSNALVRISADAVQRVYGANVRINQLSFHGNHAVATFTQYFDADRKDNAGTLSRMTSNLVLRQLWTKTEDGWQVQRTRTLQGEINIDGKITRI